MEADDSEKQERSVEFEQPLPVKIMSIDGTWGGDAYLISISESEAEIEAAGQIADLTEFFLLLTSFGQPVYRRCRRKWVRGARTGVLFIKSKTGVKPPVDESL